MTYEKRDERFYIYYENDQFITSGTIKEIAEETNQAEKTLRKYITRAGKTKNLEFVGIKKKIFAYYYGDEFISTGTLEQLGNEFNTTRNNLLWMMNPAVQERTKTRIIQIEGEYMIQKNTRDKKAFKPVNIDEINTETKIIKKPAKKGTWKPGPYTKMLHDQMFKGWG